MIGLGYWNNDGTGQKILEELYLKKHSKGNLVMQFFSFIALCASFNVFQYFLSCIKNKKICDNCENN